MISLDSRTATAPLPRREISPAPDNLYRLILDSLAVAIYTTDAEGHLSYFNEAAVDLWGRRPQLGSSQWCGSWRLFYPDGTPMDHGACPMAQAVKERRPITGAEAIAERPDGVRVPFIPYPTPLFDADGTFIGAVNVLVDITDRKQAEMAAQRLAAIVESSDDAILSKDLNGVISSWNSGAERLFGYVAEEVIGEPITILIPKDRWEEEPAILARIRAGERIDHYETVRRRKDGSLVEISLTVSPVKTPAGRIVGASKIARDITERRRAQEQQQLLVREMNHRIKNLFALAGSIVALSARSATTAENLASEVRNRLVALASAHALTLSSYAGGSVSSEPATTLHALIRAITSPYDTAPEAGASRISVTGPDIALAGAPVTSFALLLHEFAANAAKYGALSSHSGRVEIECADDGDHFVMVWRETGGPPVSQSRDGNGFGSLLAKFTVEGHLGGKIKHDWRREGLVIRMTADRERLQA